MKKLVSLLLAICVCFSVSVMLTACGHEHTYQTEWSKDATHHWHACTEPTCVEKADVAPHEWDDGEEVKPATKDEDGEVEFTCIHCGATKNDALEYVAKTTVSEEEWKNAFNRVLPSATVKAETFKATVTIDENGKLAVELGDVISTVITKWSGSSVEQIKVTNEGNQSQFADGNAPEGYPLVRFDAIFYATGALLEFSSFEYDPDTKTYVYYMCDDNGLPTDVVFVYIEDGVVTYLLYAQVNDSSAGTFYNTTVYNIYDIGTTVISNAN